jgi:hypothetical protein
MNATASRISITIRTTRCSFFESSKIRNKRFIEVLRNFPCLIPEHRFLHQAFCRLSF